MAERTSIEWCDSTCNPWTGCTKVSPACDHCYAEAWSKRAGDKVGKWGPRAPRVRTTPANWRKPVQWNAKRFMQCRACGWRGEAAAPVIGCGKCGSIELDDTRRRVFCSSLADVFDNEVDPEWRRDLLRLIASTQDLDWLLLTKRIGNASRMLADAAATFGMTWGDHWRNVWLGATLANREEMLRDGPKLKAVEAAVRFWSVEPMLGPLGEIPHDLLPDWVICGGESGPGARPMHPDWVRSLGDQCEAAGVPFLFKQWGEWIPYEHSAQPPFLWSQHGHELDAHALPDFESEEGRHQTEWHCDFASEILARRVGKKAAGRMLDGRTHDAFPRGHGS